MSLAFCLDDARLHGDYSLVVKLRFVEPVSRVRFSLVAQVEDLYERKFTVNKKPLSGFLFTFIVGSLLY